MRRITNAAMLTMMSMAFLACGEDETQSNGGAAKEAVKTPWVSDEAQLSSSDAYVVMDGKVIYEHKGWLEFEDSRLDQLANQPAANAVKTEDGVIDFRITKEAMNFNPYTIRCTGAFGDIVSHVMITLDLPDDIAPEWAKRLRVIDECARRDDADDVVAVEVFDTPRLNPAVKSITTWANPDDPTERLTLYIRSVEKYPAR